MGLPSATAEIFLGNKRNVVLSIGSGAFENNFFGSYSFQYRHVGWFQFTFFQ